MPQVRYGQRQIGPAPIARVRNQAAETAESLGAGVEQAKERRAGVISAVAGTAFELSSQAAIKIATDEKRRVDDFTVLAQQNRVSEALNTWQYTGDNAAYRRQGEDARGLHDEFETVFEKAVADASVNLKNREQRDAFRAWLPGQKFSVSTSVKRYSLAQQEALEDKETQAAIENSVVTAAGSANNPRDVGLALARAEQVVRVAAKHKGIPGDSELVKAQINDVRDKVHVAVIDQLLAEDQWEKAKFYYEGDPSKDQKGIADQITDPKVREHITKALEVGTLRGQADDAADAIVLETDNLAERDKFVKERYKGLMRKEVQQRIDYERSKAEALEDLSVKQALSDIYSALRDSKGDMNAVNTNDLVIAAAHTPQIESFAAAMRTKAKDVETDLATWYDVRKMMGDPAREREFLDANLLDYADRISQGQLQQIMDVQQSALNGNKAALSTATIDTQLFNTLADAAGVNVYDAKTPEDKRRVGQLMNAVEKRIAEQQAATKKLLTREQKEVEMRAILKQDVMYRTWLGASHDVKIAATVLQSEAGRVYVPIAKVPKTTLDAFVSTITQDNPTARQMSQQGKDAEIVKRWQNRIERAYALFLMGRSEAEIDAALLGKDDQ